MTLRRRYKRLDLGDHAVGFTQVPDVYGLGVEVSQRSAVRAGWRRNLSVFLNLGPWTVYYEWG